MRAQHQRMRLVDVQTGLLRTEKKGNSDRPHFRKKGCPLSMFDLGLPASDHSLGGEPAGAESDRDVVSAPEFSGKLKWNRNTLLRMGYPVWVLNMICVYSRLE